MRYHALACDYDGTIATAGSIPSTTEAALRRLRASGRKLLLVTGRLLEDLQEVCPALPMFDAVVAENGALLALPGRAERLLGAPPADLFVAMLRARGVSPMVEGRVIVATLVENAPVVADVMRALGLERALATILNKHALMVLPVGIDKGSGLEIALAELSIAPEATIAAGDAENDLAMLERAGLAVAVANALPSIKEAADLVTTGAAGDGIAELCDEILTSDT